MSDPVIQIAETIQTASINRHPSPKHDINPSTSASNKQPVELDTSPDSSVFDVEEDEIPVSVLRPVPRRSQLPPLPDLRFEQSYLASIQNAGTWQQVTYITLRDQVCGFHRRHLNIQSSNRFPGFHAFDPGPCMDSHPFRLEILEQYRSI